MVARGRWSGCDVVVAEVVVEVLYCVINIFNFSCCWREMEARS